MKLKRFIAADTTKALRKIKEAFGDEAVILSSHSVADGVEVVAAIDYDESVIKKSLPSTITKTTKAANSSQHIQSPKRFTELDDVREEVMHLRELIENQLSGFAWQNISHYEPMQMMLIKRLTKLGFEINICEKLVKHVSEKKDPQKAWLSLLSYLLRELKFQEPDLLALGGYHVFVGPTGVGKTTTIAKLAARYCLQYGADNLGLVTMDGYRIAAVEQLVTFAKILGVSVSVAQNRESLQTTVNKLSNKKLVLIDTAGMNPKDIRVKKQFEMLQSTDVPISPTLVMSATSQYHVLESTYNHYLKYNIENTIITKLDEAESMGAPMSLLINNKLPLAYITNGQRVPEDLQIASNQTVLEHLISSQDTLNNDINLNELIASLSGSNVYA